MKNQGSDNKKCLPAMSWEDFFDARRTPFLLHDGSFRILSANRSYLERAGTDMTHILGQPYHTIFPKADGPLAASLSALASRKATEPRNEESGGGVFRAQAIPIPGPDGPVVGLVLEDVTRSVREGRALDSIRDLSEAVVDRTLSRLEEGADIDPLIEGILHGAMDLTGADGALVALLDPETDTFTFRWRFGVFKEMDGSWQGPFPAGRGVTGEVLRRGEGIVVRDYASFPDPLPPFLSLNLQCGAIVPFSRGRGLQGVLALVSSRDGDLFSEDHLPMVRTMARSVGLALERHDLIEALASEKRIFADIVRTVPEILFAYSFERKALTFVSAGIAALGIGPEELRPDVWEKRIEEKVLKGVRETLEESLSRGKDRIDFDLPVRDAGGSRRWFSVRTTVRRDRSGKPVDLLGAAFDFTARSLLEEEKKTAIEERNTLIAAIPDGVWLKDGGGAWRIVNPAGLALFGLQGRTDWVGKTERELAMLNPPLAEAHLGCLTTDEEAWVGGRYTDTVEPVTTPDGAVHVIESRKIPLFNEDGSRKSLVVIGRDATERLRAEAEMKLSGLVFEKSPFAIIITDADNRILRVNPAFTAITGYSPEEAKGEDPHILKSDSHGPEFYRRMWEALRREGSWEGEILDRRKNGEIYPGWLSIVAFRERGKVRGYIGLFYDLTERKRDEERLRYLSTSDPLTGLPNRQTLREVLERTIRGGTGRMAILMIDLDRFKTVNDSMGHTAGDAILREAGRRLSEINRSDALVARMGGDEFVVAIPDRSGSPEVGVIAVVRRIQEVLRHPFFAGKESIRLDSSVGISLFPDDGHSVEELLRKGEIALYKAKEEGRGSFRFFDPGQEKNAQELLRVEQSMKKGLDRGEFFLYYQPVVDPSGRLASVEALARWKHPSWGLVSPARFIPVAEQSGLILALGEILLKTACNQARDWALAGRTIPVAVNISPRQFLQESFLVRVESVLGETGVDPSLLIFEITESLLLLPDENILLTFEKLRNHGIRFALDDFGTGYSSLRSLRNFPVETIKIDQSFVRDLAQGESDREIVRTIVSMADALKKRVIAEGVETEEQRRLLSEIGPMHYQGFLFGKPQDPTGVLDFGRV